MTREEARQAFKDSKIEYAELSYMDIKMLTIYVDNEFKEAFINDEINSMMYTNKKIQIKKDKYLNLTAAFLFVDGSYFEKRECISFNQDGFIGFAGWASDKNVKPIIKGFIKWLKDIERKLNK